MNQVMRRSACCLLSSLLLWSCVGCTKAAHESFGDGSVQSGSEHDDAAKQAYKAFTVDALDRVAVDDLNSSGKLVLETISLPAKNFPDATSLSIINIGNTDLVVSVYEVKEPHHE